MFSFHYLVILVFGNDYGPKCFNLDIKLRTASCLKVWCISRKLLRKVSLFWNCFYYSINEIMLNTLARSFTAVSSFPSAITLGLQGHRSSYRRRSRWPISNIRSKGRRDEDKFPSHLLGLIAFRIFRCCATCSLPRSLLKKSIPRPVLWTLLVLCHCIMQMGGYCFTPFRSSFSTVENASYSVPHVEKVIGLSTQLP